MNTLLNAGAYRLFETKRNTKVLFLDQASYGWSCASGPAEIWPLNYRPHKTDCLLSAGRYHLYEVRDDPGYSDAVHLELEAGRGRWQGYLLLPGLPSEEGKAHGRVIPTAELITGKQEEAYHANL